MLTFDRKPCSSPARSPDPMTASQRAVRSPSVSPPRFRLASPGEGGAAGRLDLARFRITPPVQRKPTISAPGDASEREADEVAERVMRMADPAPIGAAPAAVQRKCAACEDEEDAAIQTKRAPAANAGAALDGEAAVRAARRGGEPLPRAVRELFEPRFGYDFGDVRVHVGGDAASAARAVEARAYTTGRDIVFGAGEYAPATLEGQRLLAHELTHVVQQASFASRPSGLSGARPARIARQPAPSADGEVTNLLGDALATAIVEERFAFVFAELDMRDMKPMLDVLDRLAAAEIEVLIAHCHAPHTDGRFAERLRAALTTVWIAKGGGSAGMEVVKSGVEAIAQTAQTAAIVAYLKAHAATEDARILLHQLSPEADEAPRGAAGAAEGGVLSAFKQAVRKRALAALEGNLTAIEREEAKYADTREESAAWARLREIVKPMLARDRQLKQAAEDFDAQAARAGEAARAVAALVERSEGEGGAEGGRADSPMDHASALLDEQAQLAAPLQGAEEGAPAERAREADVSDAQGELEASAALWKQRAASARAARQALRAAYPILAAGDLLHDEGQEGASGASAKGADTNEQLLAKIRVRVFGASREAIARTKERILSDSVPLDELGPIVREVEREMRLGDPARAQDKAIVDGWIAQTRSRERTLQIAVAGAAVAFGIAAIVTGGAAAVMLGLIGSTVGLAGAIHDVRRAGALSDAATAGDIGAPLLDDPDAAKAAYHMALVDLVLSGIDFAVALKQARSMATVMAPERAAGRGAGGGARAAGGATADVTREQLAAELDYLARNAKNPKVVRGEPPRRTARLGEHDWIEQPGGGWCRYSTKPACTPQNGIPGTLRAAPMAEFKPQTRILDPADFEKVGDVKQGLNPDKIRLRQRSTGKEYLFKPASAEQEANWGNSMGILAGDRARKTPAAAELAERLGIPTPKADLVDYGGEIGSLQDWQHDLDQGESLKELLTLNQARYAEVKASQLKKDLDTFNYFIGAMDSHEGDMIVFVDSVGKPSRIVQLDNDISLGPLPTRYPYLGKALPGYHEPLPGVISKDLYDRLSAMSTASGQADVRKALQAWLTEKEMDSAFIRLNEILDRVKAGTIKVE
ncbi:eCIS core domain-containing protein [Sorangium sp. So ce204]|uniref:eCIS core domain-containing protein n=1 Tax=Sorangium sp. So ce204 TaxID=3133288 RepID=UPI003F5EEE5B